MTKAELDRRIAEKREVIRNLVSRLNQELPIGHAVFQDGFAVDLHTSIAAHREELGQLIRQMDRLGGSQP
jgi:hypothetical protein